jgi:hypothetical protein
MLSGFCFYQLLRSLEEPLPSSPLTPSGLGQSSLSYLHLHQGALAKTPPLPCPRLHQHLSPQQGGSSSLPLDIPLQAASCFTSLSLDAPLLSAPPSSVQHPASGTSPGWHPALFSLDLAPESHLQASPLIWPSPSPGPPAPPLSGGYLTPGTRLSSIFVNIPTKRLHGTPCISDAGLSVRPSLKSCNR